MEETPKNSNPPTGTQVEYVETADAGDVKRRLDTVAAALDDLARVAARYGGDWGNNVAAFAVSSAKNIPTLPTLKDLSAQQRASAVGSWADVRFSPPGKYLILAVDEEKGQAMAALPGTTKTITPTFGMVTVDPTREPAFDAASLG